MQKKLLAVAVAGAMFAPAAVMAQSAVTISGVFKMSVDQYKIGNPASPARDGLNTSETRVTDNSSQIHFNVTEDIGGGLAGIAKLDVRFAPDTGTIAASGNTWVGLRSSSLGTLTFGRHDLHYGKQPDEVAAKGALQASSNSLMDFVGNTAIAGATRTPNVIRWDSPNWSGFNLTVAYSTGAGGEGDMATGVRKGNAWNLNPSYTASNFQVGYSFWNSKPDGGGTTLGTGDQKSHSIYGFYRFGAFKVGAAYKTDEIEGTGAGATTLSDRKAWTIPVAWFAGPHTVALTYTRAGDDDATTADDKANMIAATYSYDLSKRTALALTYARISNNPAATYDFFTVGTFGGANNLTNAGEDPRLLSATVRHAF